MSVLTISALKELAGAVPTAAAVMAQLQARATRLTKGGKPYCELTFADATGNCLLKIWSDAPCHEDAMNLPEGSIVRLEAEWTQNQFGLNPKDLTWQPVDESHVDDFYAGDPALREKQEADYAAIAGYCESIGDPRLHALCAAFLEQMGARFRRAAAARRNHHARRGGLVEHVARMMRSAAAISQVYPELNRDLLMAGVLFHDCGKLWENGYPETGFTQIHSLHGEMMGHIPLGIELANKLWRDLAESAEAATWAALQPPAEHVRLHLLHLIASHHGTMEFGSPVLPRTPEAFALHYIDNLDAKLEMVADAYAKSREIVPHIYDRVFPLPTNLVRPLAAWVDGADPSSEDQPA